jgi:hypothetical protein
MPTDVLDVVVEDVTTDPWSDFVEGPIMDLPTTCTCCSTCAFSQPEENVN